MSVTLSFSDQFGNICIFSIDHDMYFTCRKGNGAPRQL